MNLEPPEVQQDSSKRIACTDFAKESSGVRISAILVSYNTCELTTQCVETLWEQLDPARDEIIVVDNASSDATLSDLRQKWPVQCNGQDHPNATSKEKAVRIIENPINAGFGAANNLGMAQARGQYFLLINTDAFVESNAILAMLSKLKSEKSWGVVGPKLLNRDRSLQRSCFRFPEPSQAWREAFALHYILPDIERWSHNRDRVVDFVSGACFLIRRSVYEAVGGFDERYFMYCEESDWQKRITAAGWHIGFTPSAEVVHYGGGSNKTGKVHPDFFLSLDKYQLKHHGWMGLILFRLGMITGITIRLPYRIAKLIAGDRKSLFISLRLLYRQAFCWRDRGIRGAA
jgi:hypothetical protein